MQLSRSLYLADIRSAARRSGNTSSADHVFSLSPGDLVVLGKRREGIGHRLLREFVPLETHTLKDFASAQTVRIFSDDFQQGFPPSSRLCTRTRLRRQLLDRRFALSWTTGLSSRRCRFTGFRRLIGIDRRQLAVDVGELVFQILLLAEDLFAFAIQTFPLPLHHIRKPDLIHLPGP